MYFIICKYICFAFLNILIVLCKIDKKCSVPIFLKSQHLLCYSILNFIKYLVVGGWLTLRIAWKPAQW